MKRTRHATEQIIEKLREADVALGKGQKVPDGLPPIFMPVGIVGCRCYRRSCGATGLDPHSYR